MEQAKAGWYPDEKQDGWERYWNGSKWVGNARKKKGTGFWATLPLWAKIGVPVIIVVIIGAAAGGGDDKSDKSDNSSATVEKNSGNSGGTANDADTKSEEEEDSCGTEATDDCTPHVGPHGKVKVDGLVWQIKSAKTASTIGDSTYGLQEKANGVYLITKLKVLSTKDESVSISDEIIQLSVDEGNSYAADSDGTLAESFEGEDTFTFEDIGPNSTLEGVVVFDVPKSVLNATLELEFSELGFGETKGFIEVPSPQGG
jgi:hypothetical protein